MSRRDTIIIALLVNSGVLALLFMLAVNVDEESSINQTTGIKIAAETVITEPIASTVPLIAESKTSTPPTDMDSFFGNLSTEELSQPILIDEESLSIAEFLPEEKPKNSQETAPTGPFVEVKVKKGDALEKIARNNGTTIEAIKEINNLSSNKLSIGQVLKIPVSKKSTISKQPKNPPQEVASKEPQKKTSSADAEYYTLKNGDSPWKIAKQFNVSFEELLRINDLDEERARNLKIGDKIRIR